MLDRLKPPTKKLLPLFLWEEVIPEVGVLEQKLRDDLKLGDSY